MRKIQTVSPPLGMETTDGKLITSHTTRNRRVRTKAGSTNNKSHVDKKRKPAQQRPKAGSRRNESRLKKERKPARQRTKAGSTKNNERKPARQRTKNESRLDKEQRTKAGSTKNKERKPARQRTKAGRTKNESGRITLRAPHFRHLPPNSARFSYATEGVLFISAQLSTDAVSALRKI